MKKYEIAFWLSLVSFYLFISFHFISFRFVSFRFVSFHFISFHFVSFRFVSFCFLLFCLFCFVFFVLSFCCCFVLQSETSTFIPEKGGNALKRNLLKKEMTYLRHHSPGLSAIKEWCRRQDIWSLIDFV